MSHLSIENKLNIYGLAIAKFKKTTIAKINHCSVSTVYNVLNQLQPRDNSAIKMINTRRKGNYKISAQTGKKIIEYFTLNKHATLRSVIVELGLNVKAISTISKYLSDNGIHNYTSKPKPFITFGNQLRRLL